MGVRPRKASQRSSGGASYFLQISFSKSDGVKSVVRGGFLLIEFVVGQV